LRGSDTHGVIRLPLYVRRLLAGGINAAPNIQVISESASVALIDGDNGMGHLVMHCAAIFAISVNRSGCPGSTASGFPASRPTPSCSTGATAVPMPKALRESLDAVARELKIAALP